jgi:serine/threonine protein kinase
MAFTVPGYRVGQLLGYGSHAEVWSATAAGSGEPVALKRIVLDTVPAEQAGRIARAARIEAALLAALEHPSLIRLREFLATNTAVVLVLDLAEGGSLAELLRRRDRLTPAEIAATFSPVAAALAHAHDEGVLHGDLSAANILFTAAGQPMLADLGMARLLGSLAQGLGTPAYLDPVVAAGGAAGAASDVFSLAAVALHCVSGAGPWQPVGSSGLDSAAAALARAATGVIDGLPGRLGGCPAEMAAVLSRALNPEPHRRGTAAEFALDLRASVQPAPVVLASGRIQPKIGRHSVDRAAASDSDGSGSGAGISNGSGLPNGSGQPAFGRALLAGNGMADSTGGFLIPADLTHVSRPRVRPAVAQPSDRWHRISARIAALRQGGGLGRPEARPADRSARLGGSAARVVLALTGAGILTGLLLAWWLRGGGAAPPITAKPPLAGTGAQSTAGRLSSAVDPLLALRTLADRRAAAFALRRPELLASVYQSAALLSQDVSQLANRVPDGCGLTGLHTSYREVTSTAADGGFDLRVTASQPAAALVCRGQLRGRSEPAGPVRLGLRLVRAGAEYRIASEQELLDGR